MISISASWQPGLCLVSSATTLQDGPSWTIRSLFDRPPRMTGTGILNRKVTHRDKTTDSFRAELYATLHMEISRRLSRKIDVCQTLAPPTILHILHMMVSVYYALKWSDNFIAKRAPLCAQKKMIKEPIWQNAPGEPDCKWCWTGDTSSCSHWRNWRSKLPDRVFPKPYNFSILSEV